MISTKIKPQPNSQYWDISSLKFNPLKQKIPFEIGQHSLLSFFSQKK